MPDMDIEHQLWRDSSACADSGIDFFDLRVDNLFKVQQLCGECPVEAECLDASLWPRLESYGLWGGMRPDTRRRLRKKVLRDKLKARKAANAAG